MIDASSISFGIAVTVSAIFTFHWAWKEYKADIEKKVNISRLRLVFATFIASAILFTFTSLVLWLLISSAVRLLTNPSQVFQNDGISCGRYEDMDECVERAEQQQSD